MDFVSLYYRLLTNDKEDGHNYRDTVITAREKSPGEWKAAVSLGENEEMILKSHGSTSDEAIGYIVKQMNRIFGDEIEYSVSF